MSPTLSDKATGTPVVNYGEDARIDRIARLRTSRSPLETSTNSVALLQRMRAEQGNSSFDTAGEPDTSSEMSKGIRAKPLARASAARHRSAVGALPQPVEAVPGTVETAAVRDAVERERRRIARDIHDHVEQWLAVAGMRLTLAEQVAGIGAPALAEVRRCLGELDAGLRTVTQELRAPTLTIVDLPHRLRELAAGWSADFGIPVVLHLGAVKPAAQADGVAETLAHVARTMLNNVAKHASTATRVDLRLAVRGGRLWLSVADDGPGFDAGRALAAAGTGRGRLGLAAMRERLGELGGDLLVVSEPGRGTIVTAVVPLGRDRRPATERDAR
jgi:signal transduction histidine kinase